MHEEVKPINKEANWLTKPASFPEDPDFINYKVSVLDQQVHQALKQGEAIKEELELYKPEDKYSDDMYV